MKVLFLLTVSALVGGSAGAAVALWSVGPAPPLRVGAADPSAPAANGSAAVLAAIAEPLAVVEEPTHDFGTMLRGDASSHEFVVRNDGTAPLRLAAGPTSCKCTLSKVATDPIPPGGSTPVRLEWTAKSLAGPFRQTATIKTNDPARRTLTLTVEGDVTEVDGLWPAELDLGVIDTDAGGTAEAYLMAFEEADLQVTAEMAATTERPERYAVSVEPLDPAASPAADAVAVAKITVRADAGLSQGPIHEWVTIRSNLAGREEFLMPITGRVRGAIAIHGRGWNREAGVLNLGVLSGAGGGGSTILLACRGPQASTIEYQVEGVDPPELVAELGEQRMIRDDLSHTKLRVEVPPGTRPMVRMERDVVDGPASGGDAVIRLRSNHPRSPEVKLFVRFVVQG